MVAEKKAAAAPTAKQRAARAKALEPRVRTAIKALDTQGRWIAGGKGGEAIRTEVFVGNMRTLCEYVEAVK